ncbi:hypothetical protein FKB36_00930 [Methanoculleus sp. Afa-1]|uniref:Uncharacterized protein n=1 Tax=Methanoculleus formosensis TaxID=2590886 RepID=A0A9E4ZJ20_9EURY|nr:hypothetical protein [Methanoculleus sp. Afa-1]MCT8336097.1 hypothetical protein [Methanoculleus sp. Afa-1]
MIRKNPLLPALLLVVVATVLVAGFAAFGPGTEVAGTSTPQELVMVHIDSFTEKRDASARDPGDLGISSSIRRYDLAVYDTQAIRDHLLRGESLTVYIAGQPYKVDLQESLHDPESRSAGRHSFSGTLDGGGAALLTISDSVLLALFRIGGVEYYVESTGQHDTVFPERILHYVYSSADVVPEGPPAMLSGCYLILHNISNGKAEHYGFELPANWTEADFRSAGYEIAQLTDADLAELPTVNETLHSGGLEVLLSEDEAGRIAKSYRGKIVEYRGSYYLIDFIVS